jgi:RimJ/RimL family protein N-acetyltransferase
MILDAGDVLLRPYENRDRDGLITILGEAELMQLVLDERPLSNAQAGAFIDSHFHGTGHLGYRTVALKSNDDAIGFSGFRTCRYLGEDDVEFGWVLSKKYHGRGYATALGEQLIRHALESWRLPRILAACNPQNHASERILRDKLQMRFERQVEPRAGFCRRVYSAAPGWHSSSR